ncbi:MAG: hypothetical protein H6933_01860 [Burkholderiaceae bacterium]|nr:hypothetical protein [Burkholderiaceae bacterium]
MAALGDDGRVWPLPGSPAAAPVIVPAGPGAAGPPAIWHATSDARVRRWAWHGAAAVPWQAVAEARLPEPAHALAAGAHGELLAAHGHALTLLDAQGQLLRRYEGQDLARSRRGRAAALFGLPHRSSLLAAWPALQEWWEISLDPAAPPVFDGYVHDHRMGEAIASPGHLGVRRVPFDTAAPVPAFAPAGWPWVACAAGDGVGVVHLDVRRSVARLAVDATALAASAVHEGLWWLPVGRRLWGIDPRRWQPVRQREGPGPVQALAVGSGQLQLLSEGTVWRWDDAQWRPSAGGLAALASGGDAGVATAPPPWQGVAALAP